MPAAQRHKSAPSSRTRILVVAIGALVLGALVLALSLSIAGEKKEDAEYHAAAVFGASLPPLDSADPLGVDDPSIGATAPVIEGYDLKGNLFTISGSSDGHPTIVALLAHWCPHCQRDVPKIVEWYQGLDQETAPHLMAVATSIDPVAPNYPPEDWLEREQWPTNVIYDGEGDARDAYGLSGFPFYVILDGDGTVVRRMAGEVDLSVLEEVLVEAA